MIDAHHHLWTSSYAWLQDPGLAAIRRDDDLRPYAAAALDLIPEDLHAAVFGGTAVRTYGWD